MTEKMEGIFKNLRQIIDDFEQLNEEEKSIVWSVIDDWCIDFNRKDGWGDNVLPEEDEEKIKNIEKKYNLP
jgi:hypothetical protein